MPPPSAVVIARAHEQKAEQVPQAAGSPASLPKFVIMIRYRGKDVATEIPLSLHTISVLALHAMLRDLGITELLAQILAAVISKDLIQEILQDPA
jgi:hypothetical protein